MDISKAKLLQHPVYHHIHDDRALCAPCQAKGYLEGHAAGEKAMRERAAQMVIANTTYYGCPECARNIRSLPLYGEKEKGK